MEEEQIMVKDKKLMLALVAAAPPLTEAEIATSKQAITNEETAKLIG